MSSVWASDLAFTVTVFEVSNSENFISFPWNPSKSASFAVPLEVLRKIESAALFTLEREIVKVISSPSLVPLPIVPAETLPEVAESAEILVTVLKSFVPVTVVDTGVSAFSWSVVI